MEYLLSHQSIFILPPFFTGLLALGLGVWLNDRNTPAYRVGAAWMACTALWMLAGAFELVGLNITADWVSFFTRLRLVGLSLSIYSFLWVALVCTPFSAWMKPGRFILLSIPGAVMLAIILSFHWLWGIGVLYWDTWDSTLLAAWQARLWFIGLFFYIGLSVSIVLSSLLRFYSIWGGAPAALLAALMLITLSGLEDRFVLHSVPSLLITPWAVGTSVLFIAWALTRSPLGTLVQAARRQAVDSMGDAVIILDAQQRVIDLNPAAEKLLQVEPRQSVGMQLAAIWPAWTEIMPASLAEGGLEDIPLPQPDASRFFSLKLSPLYGLGGGILGSVLVLREVTRRKRVENSLRLLQEQHRQVMDSMSDAAWLLDMDLRIVYVNPAEERLSGYTQQELVGTPILQQITPASWDQVQQAIAAELTPERLAQPGLQIDHTFEVEFISRNGSHYWSEVVATLLRDPSGAPFGLLGVGREFSARRQLETERKNRLAQLETLRQVGIELTAELDLDLLLHSIVRRMVDLLKADTGGLYFYLPEEDCLEWQVGEGRLYVPQGTRVRRGEGLVGSVLAMGVPLRAGLSGLDFPHVQLSFRPALERHGRTGVLGGDRAGGAGRLLGPAGCLPPRRPADAGPVLHPGGAGHAQCAHLAGGRAPAPAQRKLAPGDSDPDLHPGTGGTVRRHPAGRPALRSRSSAGLHPVAG
jgi:PAS domain S-box-containing protein